jgi:hypothetical protein
MNEILLFSELQHLFLSLALGLLLFWRYRDWRLVPIVLLFGFFIDIDHWFDHFACFGLNLELVRFFNFDFVHQCQRVIVPLHGWEFVIPFWFLGRWLGKKLKIKGLEWAFSLPYFSHLVLDQAFFICSRHPLAYSFIHRLLNGFSLEAFNGF